MTDESLSNSPQKNSFWTPDGDQTRNLMMTGETLYYWATKTQMVSWGTSLTYMGPEQKPPDANNDIEPLYVNDIDIIINHNYSGFGFSRTFVELVPSLTIWVLVAQQLECLTGSSKGCEFDPHLRNCLSEEKAWQTFIYHSKSPVSYK